MTAALSAPDVGCTEHSEQLGWIVHNLLMVMMMMMIVVMLTMVMMVMVVIITPLVMIT